MSRKILLLGGAAAVTVLIAGCSGSSAPAAAPQHLATSSPEPRSSAQTTAPTTPTTGPTLSFINPFGTTLTFTVYTAAETPNGDPQHPVEPVPGMDYVLVYGRLQNTSSTQTSAAGTAGSLVQVQIPIADLVAAAGPTATYATGQPEPACAQIASEEPNAALYASENTGYDPGDYGTDLGGSAADCYATLNYGQVPNGPGVGALAPGASVTGYFVSQYPIPTSIPKSDVQLFTGSEPVTYPLPYPVISLPW